MIHRLKLGNGNVLLVEEGDSCITLATEDLEQDGCEYNMGAILCEIDCNGIKVFAGYDAYDLTKGLEYNNDDWVMPEEQTTQG